MKEKEICRKNVNTKISTETNLIATNGFKKTTDLFIENVMS